MGVEPGIADAQPAEYGESMIGIGTCPALAIWVGTIASINASNLPPGNFWEADGACWQYERDEHAQCGYRMRPMNVKALAKSDGPEGPMTDFYLPDMAKA